jgi:outer membrane protein
MKTLMTLLLVLLAGIYSSAAALAADKIAYINLQAIVAESDMGKQVREEFNKIRTGMDAEIKEKIKEIELLNVTLQKEREKSPADEKAIASAANKLQQKNKEYERLAADLKEDLAKKDNALVRQILEKVAPILTELAESRGYSVIFKNTADLLYVAPAADITKEVIEQFNKEIPKQKKN